MKFPLFFIHALSKHVFYLFTYLFICTFVHLSIYLLIYLCISHFTFSLLHHFCSSGGYSASSNLSIHPTPPTNALLLLREKEKEKERVRALQQLYDAQSGNPLTEFVEEDYVETEKVQL